MRVTNYQPLLQISSSRVDEHIHNVQEVTRIIQEDPGHGAGILKAPEDGAADNKKDIVEDGQWDET